MAEEGQPTKKVDSDEGDEKNDSEAEESDEE
jgi:hypothetical protein